MAEDESLNFDPTKKKKKKPFNLEKALGDRETESKEEEPKEDPVSIEAPGGGDDDELQFTGKKKKKGAKKVVEEEAPVTETTVKDAPEEDAALQFDKKKKKKKPKGLLDEADGDDAAKDDESRQPVDDDDDGADFGGISKPLKAKDKAAKTVSFAEGDDDVDGGRVIDDEDDDTEFLDDENAENRKPHLVPSAALMKGAWVGSDRDYTYDELLTRVFDIMREKNPEYIGGEKKKIVMRPPQVVRVGTKKTSFANFTEICKIMRRQPKHLIAFLLAELGTTGSVDANNQLIIKGRFQQKQIENVLRRYIKEYVTCHTCRSPQTLLQKDDQTRVVFLQCETCGSRCSVTKVSSGYQAVTAKRAAMRAKEV